MKRIAILTIVMLGACCAVGCSSFERSTFQTLSSSQAVINQAQVDYEAGCPAANGACLPHSAAVYKAVNTAKAAQTVAVHAFMGYEAIKANNTAGSALAIAQADVVTALTNIAPDIAAVKGLYTAAGGK